MRTFIKLILLLSLIGTAIKAQWTNQGAWPSEDIKGSAHGLAVDPDGKVWVSNYFSDETIVDIHSGDTVLVGSIKVFNEDGTEADFSPIKIAKLSEFESDTLYGNCRGMRTDVDGNILYVQSSPTMMYEFDYETGEALQSLNPELGTSPTAPAVSHETGSIFIGPFIPGNPLKEFDQDFNYIGNAIDETIGFSRSFEVSDDGNTIYWAGYTNGYVTVYERPDLFSAFDSVATILEGFHSESFAWHPSSGNLWLSAGSGNDPAENGFRNHVWYEYNPSTDEILDIIEWEMVEGIDSVNQRPRAIDFSPDGETAYVSSFGTNDLPMIQKLTRGEITVTFNCDMSGQALLGNFNPEEDEVEIRGSFNGWGSSGDMMNDPDGDSVYTYVYEDAAMNDTIYFKYWSSNPELYWEYAPNRELEVNSTSVVFTDFFNRDTILSSPKDLTISYRANMEVERLSGRFDPDTDIVELRGGFFGWGPGVVMDQSSLNQDIYFHIATQNVAAGQSLPDYKFWYTPDNWEMGDNYTHTITLEEWNQGEVIIERPFNDTGLNDVTGQETTILFTVNTQNASSSITGDQFPVVNTVHLFGSFEPLNWPSGGWPDEDINLGIELFDDGSNGDEFANDGIFSALVNFSPYTPFEINYKYGINYSDSDYNEGGNDNEAGVGDEHVINLQKNLVSAKVENSFGEMGEHQLVDMVFVGNQSWSSNIQLSDAAGKSTDELIFGQQNSATDGLDDNLGEIELPPPPPTGAFDARFIFPDELTASKTDYRDTFIEEITWKIKFQPSNAGYPMTFAWNPSTFPEGTFKLKDAFGLVNVDMKNNNSYQLTNDNLNTLFIEYSKQLEQQIDFNEGWNIISVPVSTDDMNVNNLFPSATSNAFTFQDSYQIADELDNGKGYWLKFGQDGSSTISGTNINIDVPLSSGWNLIGAFNQPVNTSGITTEPTGIIESNFFGYDQTYYSTGELEVGKGYWIKVNQDGTLNYNTKVGKSNSQIAEIDKDWGKIIITDNSGNSSELYIGSEVENIQHYQLPPLPPKGVFDIRYSDDRFVMQNSEGNKQINLHGCSFPIKISSKGVDLKIKTNGISKLLQSGKNLELRDESITKIEIESLLTPAEYVLKQNYPNPFNPTTKIKYGIKQAGKVNLTVYNSLGEEVVELINKEMEPGYYETEFNANNFSSGVYIYRLKVNEFVKVRKMMLLK